MSTASLNGSRGEDSPSLSAPTMDNTDGATARGAEVTRNPPPLARAEAEAAGAAIDCDYFSYLRFTEVGDFYSVPEARRFQDSKTLYERFASQYSTPSGQDKGGLGWADLTRSDRRNLAMSLLETVELVDPHERLQGLMALQYLAQGTWGEDHDYMSWSKKNCLTILELGGLQLFFDGLFSLTEQALQGDSSVVKQHLMWTYLNVIFLIVVGHTENQLVKDAVEEPIISLFALLQDPGQAIPLKKVLLLLWKCLVINFGSLSELDKKKSDAKKSREVAPEAAPPQPVPPTNCQEPMQAKCHPWDVQRMEKSLQTNYVSSTSGLPRPLAEGLSILKDRVHATSCLPTHRAAERFYHLASYDMARFLVSLLRILLAASPTVKIYSGTIEFQHEINAAYFDADAPASDKPECIHVEQQTRQKEIVIRAVSAILLHLLKHSRANHPLQFEYYSILLVEANCVLLLLKLLNRDPLAHLTAVHEDPDWWLHCTNNEMYVAKIRERTVAEGNTKITNERNVGATIDLLRVLLKLVKYFPVRLQTLVKFKAPIIFKRIIRVQQPLVKLYSLKLLKTQVKYMGRKWRQSNMKIVSEIFEHVNMPLVDDWLSVQPPVDSIDADPGKDQERRRIIGEFHWKRYPCHLSKSHAKCIWTDGGLEADKIIVEQEMIGQPKETPWYFCGESCNDTETDVEELVAVTTQKDFIDYSTREYSDFANEYEAESLPLDFLRDYESWLVDEVLSID